DPAAFAASGEYDADAEQNAAYQNAGVYDLQVAADAVIDQNGKTECGHHHGKGERPTEVALPGNPHFTESRCKTDASALDQKAETDAEQKQYAKRRFDAGGVQDERDQSYGEQRADGLLRNADRFLLGRTSHRPA